MHLGGAKISECGCNIELTELREVVADIADMTGSAGYVAFKNQWLKAVDELKAKRDYFIANFSKFFEETENESHE
ncbi:MAG: hypothetical protein J6N15_09465 [Ruminiclostridium sp.]|nr:hypothetical protein [Ruminiclostridium sp.]